MGTIIFARLRSPDISCEAQSDAHEFECNVSIVDFDMSWNIFM